MHQHRSEQAQWTIAFDADDTIWHNEDAFAATERRFRELVAPWVGPDEADQALVTTARRRMNGYGYGAKSFGLSMIETAIDLSGGSIAAAQLQQIIGWANDLLDPTVTLIDDAVETISWAAERFDVMVITKGDLHHQRRRIASSGVAAIVRDVEVVAEKDTDTYRSVLARHRIPPDRFVMIGNSVPSDVTPVLDIGGYAIHVPYAVTWALEQGEDPAATDRWDRVETIDQVRSIIGRWTSNSGAREVVR